MKDQITFPVWANIIIILMGCILAHSVSQSLSILSIALYWAIVPDSVSFITFNEFRKYISIITLFAGAIALSLLIAEQLKQYIAITVNSTQSLIRKMGMLVIIPMICYAITFAAVFATSITIEHQRVLFILSQPK